MFYAGDAWRLNKINTAVFMWYIRHISRENPDFTSVAVDLLQSISRNLILATASICLIWHIIVTLSWPEIFITNIWFVTPVILLACGLALWLNSNYFLFAQAIWQFGLWAGITIAYYLYQQPEITFLYTFLPLIAVVTIGRRGGILAEIVVIACVSWFHMTQLYQPCRWAISLALLRGDFYGVVGVGCSHAL